MSIITDALSVLFPRPLIDTEHEYQKWNLIQTAIYTLNQQESRIQELQKHLKRLNANTCLISEENLDLVQQLEELEVKLSRLQGGTEEKMRLFDIDSVKVTGPDGKALTRVIDYPKVTPVDEAIVILADEPNPDNGNASHVYNINIVQEDGSIVLCSNIIFQHGPIADVGVNGLGNEALIAILIDRISAFQSSKFRCDENAEALMYLQGALGVLNSRTTRRKNAGVEGTHSTTAEEGR